MDQPSIDGINTWFASKAAAERGYKVVLSGIGGDELFAGYPSFSQIPRLAALKGTSSFFRNPMGKGITKKFAQYMNQPKLADFFEFSGSIEGLYFLKRGLFMPSELPAILGVDRAKIGLEKLGSSLSSNQVFDIQDGIAKVGMLESTQYLRNQLLRDSDWASMAHSLELRTPLVDASLLHELARFTPSFAAGVGKRMLANAPIKPLPESIVNRPKTGFSTPMNQWLGTLAQNKNKKGARQFAIENGVYWTGNL
jgi:asparagine synthase (glutamine-hydrolysing)